MRKFKTITEHDLLEAAFSGLWHRQYDDNRRIVVFGDDGTIKQRMKERKKQMLEINDRMREIEEKEKDDATER